MELLIGELFTVVGVEVHVRLDNRGKSCRLVKSFEKLVGKFRKTIFSGNFKFHNQQLFVGEWF